MVRLSRCASEIISRSFTDDRLGHDKHCIAFHLICEPLLRISVNRPMAYIHMAEEDDDEIVMYIVQCSYKQLKAIIHERTLQIL